MAKKRKHVAKQRKVENGITYHYGKYRVADIIYNMKVDRSRPHISETEIDRVYERFQMTRYKNRNDFNKQMSVFPYTQEELDTLWKEYEHRDELVRTGQYEEARLENYRKNYIKALEERNVPKWIINRIKSLTPQQWDKLITQPQSKKDKDSDKALPVLGGGFVSTKAGEADTGRIETFIEELEEAFNLAGLSLDIKQAVQEEMKRTPTNDLLKARSYIHTKEEHYQVYDEGDEADEILSIGRIIANRFKKEGRTYQVSKSEYKYIRGIGSTKPGTKNRALALAIISNLDED